MKFFGWGRKKDPPPIQLAHQEFKNSEYGSDQLVRMDNQPQVTTSQELAQPRPSKDFLEEGGVAFGQETWEERLQETIRFVFSHEQEGLLAIGTFALDQLAGVTHLDGHQKPPAATDHNVNSRRNSVSSVQVVIREVQSSDDEIESQHSMRSPIPACKRNESYPVFGDHDTSSASGPPSRSLSLGNTKLAVSIAKDHPSCTDSSNANTTHEAGIKLRGETKGHVLPSTTLYRDQSNSEDFYSPGVCGLFASRSRRTQKDGGKEKRRKPPEKRKGTSDSCEQLKRADSKGSLGAQLGRLWRTGCTGSSLSAKVSPEKKLTPCSPADHRPESQARGPPCIANTVAEGGAAAPGGPKPSQASEVGEQRKRRGHSFGKGWACAHNDKWIRTDSEFVVLEM